MIYQRLAEVAGEYLRKGSKVYIEGRLRTRKWQDQQGVERYTTEIIASELQMIDSRHDGQAQGQNYGNGYQASAQPAPRAPANAPAMSYQQPNMPMQASPMGGGGPMDFDDNLPFSKVGLQCKRLLHCI